MKLKVEKTHTADTLGYLVALEVGDRIYTKRSQIDALQMFYSRMGRKYWEDTLLQEAEQQVIHHVSSEIKQAFKDWREENNVK